VELTMTKGTVIALGLVCLVGFGAVRTGSAQTRRPLEPSDIFELKTVGDPRISSDWAWVAYTVSPLDKKDDSADTDIYIRSI
jgi:hypothetical protein